jgi:hypothetical protein
MLCRKFTLGLREDPDPREGKNRPMTIFTATPYADLKPGMEASTTRLVRGRRPLRLRPCQRQREPDAPAREDGDGDGKPEAVAPSAWVAALISGVLGNQLPGPGTLYLSQDARFRGPRPCRARR